MFFAGFDFGYQYTMAILSEYHLAIYNKLPGRNNWSFHRKVEISSTPKTCDKTDVGGHYFFRFCQSLNSAGRRR